MDRFAADLTASVPKVCQGWGETMAAYRFLDNDRIDWRAIMAPHRQQTQQRMLRSRWCCAYRTRPNWTLTAKVLGGGGA